MIALRDRIGPWVWLSLSLAAVVAAGIALGVVGDILSPSVWIDVIALWPVAAVGILAAPVVWLVGGRRPRHLAIGGLSVFTWLALGLALHISGSTALPVSAATVVGPDADLVSSARLVAAIDGVLTVSIGSDALYVIEPIRAGGSVGAPTAFEQLGDDTTTVVVTPTDDPGPYVFRGWGLSLEPNVQWELDLEAQRVDADLTGLAGGSVSFTSESADVAIAAVAEDSTLVFVGGSHRVFVEPDTAVVFRGQGVVPADWTLTGDGAAVSPIAGVGWAILATEGAEVRVWGE